VRRCCMGVVTETETEQSVPAEMRERRRWVVWKRIGDKKKPVGAKVNDSKTWLSFEDALETQRKADGIGFVLGDGISGLDFDQCIGEDGELHPVVKRAIEMLKSYAELSPSGNGIHILVRGNIERGRKFKATATLPKREIYSEGRYFTFTGRRISEATALANGPVTQAALDAITAEMFSDAIAHDGEPGNLHDHTIIELLKKAKNRDKFERLYRGDISGYGSQSEADLALCRLIRFYTREPGTIDRVFRSSGLMRPKWNELHGMGTYGAETIAKALAMGGKVYTRCDPAAHEIWQRQAWGRNQFWWAMHLKGYGELPLRLVMLLAAYADAENGECWPSVPALARDLGVTEKTIQNNMKVLAALKIVTVQRRHNDSNLYRLSYEVKPAISPLCPSSVVKGPCVNPRPNTSDIDTGGGYEELKKRIKPKKLADCKEN
jgi:putative DNA primase/helicase